MEDGSNMPDVDVAVDGELLSITEQLYFLNIFGALGWGSSYRIGCYLRCRARGRGNRVSCSSILVKKMGQPNSNGMCVSVEGYLRGKASVGGLPDEESCSMTYWFLYKAGVGDVLCKKVAFGWCPGKKVKYI